MNPESFLAEKSIEERRLRFLLEGFPAGLERNAPHLQITDNYITNTNLRLRKIRVPETNAVHYLLSKITNPKPKDASWVTSVNTILSPAEYGVLSIFEGNELRKNRYLYEFEGRQFTIDFYLGPLWGLFIASTTLKAKDRGKIPLPAFAVTEITGEQTFTAPRLTSLTIAEIRFQFNLN